MNMMLLLVGLCNTTTILTSDTFSTSTSYSLYWNGTSRQSQLNTQYCFAISSLGNASGYVTATPITIDFNLLDSEVVVEYSLISVANTVMFETDDLLVTVNLRDQWNQTIDAQVAVIDEDGSNIGTVSTSYEIMKYNATLKRGRFISTKTLYLSGVNEQNPHVSFYGTMIETIPDK